MEIKVNFLDKLRLEAKFDDFTVVADQPIRYKGDGSAPGPFDYFLASSALCAAYFVKLYCDTRNIPTDNIRLSQNNIVDPENRYKQVFKIQVELPADISAADRQGILRSIERCTVKKVVQTGPEFVIEEVDNLDADAQALLALNPATEASTYILGKDLPLEQTIANMSGVLAGLGIKIEIASWRNLVPNVWSLHIRDAHSPMCFTNGKGGEQGKRPGFGAGRVYRAPQLQSFLQRPVLGRRHRQCALRALPGRALVQAGPQGCAAGRAPRRILPRDLQPRRRIARLASVRHQFRQYRARHLRAALRAPVGRRSGLFSDQPDRQPVSQQWHERRQYAG